MILRKLLLYGFKSFAEKTEIRFGDGLTAVIGPNGCGKSNVVDAVRWVFGEQKPSMLRSATMQDVIFSGTQKRQPLGMAEVTLIIENTRGILPIEYNEVAITRRVFRNGDGEYLINKKPCRLRDIHGLFLDTGVGSNMYTTIENSMINAILSDKAEDRRVLFEEAAGIGKYKQRIRESQRKLDRTKQDLLRINDRLGEKEKYVKMLARQVEKAKRYKRYRDDLMNLEVAFENSHYILLSDSVKTRRDKLLELEKKFSVLRSDIAKNDSEIESLEITKIDKERELQSASQEVSATSERINDLDREIATTNTSISYMKQELVRLDKEMNSSDGESDGRRKLLAKIESGIIDKSAKLEAGQIRFEEESAELADYDSQLMSTREKVKELSDEQLEIIQNFGKVQRAISTAQVNLSSVIELGDRDEREIKNLEVRLKEYLEATEIAKTQLREESESYNNYMSAREELRTRVENEESRYHNFVESEKALSSKIDSYKTQLKFYEGLKASFDGYNSGVKSLIMENLPGTLGIVGDLIEATDSKDVSVIEKILGDNIQTVVFDTNENLRGAVSFLQKKNIGTAKVISMENLNNVELFVPAKPVDGTRSIRNSIKTRDGYEKLADYFFNNVLVGDNFQTALDFVSKASVGTVLVSYDGVISDSYGVIEAGSHDNEEVGILQRNQEIDRLQSEIPKTIKKYEDIVHEKENCIITRDEAKRALIEVDEKLNRGRQKKQEQETTIKHNENEIQNIKDRITQLRPELEHIKEQSAQYKETISKLEQELEEMGSTQQEIESQIESSRSKLLEMEETRAEMAEHLKHLELSLQGQSNNIDQDKQSVARLRREIEQIAKDKKNKFEIRNNTATQIENLNSNQIVSKESLARFISQRENLQKKLSKIREEYNGVINKIEDLRKVVRQNQIDSERLSNEMRDLEVKSTRDEEQCRSIREKIYQAYEIDLENPKEELPILDREDAEVVDNINVLKERLRRVGEVNMGALSEYETESTELENLSTQRDDLQSAVDDLERAIRKLNKEARTQFVETFEKVQKNFTEIFTTLFHGGEAHIALEENVDPLEAAIHINARPAGKKMRGVTLLSGGERALTAISLLFALYMERPSAYCILDELDAPLDDANIDRFLRMLRKFSETTQFIVITHSKKTMEAADIIYGVTQQESGVSTIASLLLKETDLKAA